VPLTAIVYKATQNYFH